MQKRLQLSLYGEHNTMKRKRELANHLQDKFQEWVNKTGDKYVPNDEILWWLVEFEEDVEEQ